mgnify:CR=1 FL=1|tara:strand:+ start:2566 stop:3084 length:519 start_codon:yes stop_codon:yes gene_type:complete
MQKIIKITTIFFLVFILGIFYLSLNRDTNYDTENLVGNKLANINLEDFNNDKIFTNDDFQNNNYMLINFWASWCAPCRDEHKYLMELSKERSIKLLGVNFKDKKINALKFLKDLGNPYDYLTKDSLGKNSVNFGIYGIPESILIDSEFRILKKIIGPIKNNDLKEIKEIIKS